MDKKFVIACYAEFIAMMFFVILCCGCAMVTLNLPNVRRYNYSPIPT